ncbi:sugar ABC transporter ATP-binding protein [Polaromonas sp. LjRoot131]|uniref:sugar ABC transporter ATP-binding protein n=1 Tax=Polaromonas sp. LjRoot131 TaxID=3342262 RepID=UPI003ECC4B01
MNPAVGFQQVTKRFGPVQVLHGVSFAFAPGRVYGVLGENGAGKSTLMKILAGYEQASEGSVEIAGQAVSFRGPRDAEAEGIVMIHQEFNLADDLTIAQNIFLGHELIRHGFLDEAEMARRAEAAMRSVGLSCSPGRRVRDLIVAEKQLVEIAKALSRNARVLVMDEPTATLTPSETERLFGLIAQLRDRGATVLYISHKLDEVERITDEVLVMRDGRLVAQRLTGSVSRHQMASLMVGRELSDLFPPRQPVPDGTPVLLKVEGLQVPGWAQDVSFQVRSGEILGFAGLVGAGRTELFEGLLGLRPSSCAAVEITGRPWTRRSPRSAARMGLTYLSEDRKGRGLHLRMGLAENLTLMALEHYARPWLNPAAERAALKQASEAFGIRASAGVPASALSGGNQQKLALARVLQPQPEVVVLDEPTRGVDVGAKRDIYFLIQRLAAEGRAVVIVSSELLELIGLCHRVIVMRQGRLAAELPQDQLTEELLIAHATGTH